MLVVALAVLERMCGWVCLLSSSTQETAFPSAIMKVLTFVERITKSFAFLTALLCKWSVL